MCKYTIYIGLTLSTYLNSGVSTVAFSAVFERWVSFTEGQEAAYKQNVLDWVNIKVNATSEDISSVTIIRGRDAAYPGLFYITARIACHSPQQAATISDGLNLMNARDASFAFGVFVSSAGVAGKHICCVCMCVYTHPHTHTHT